MEGIYTVNIDGTNQQQISTSGSVPAWQSVDAIPVPAATAQAPKTPNTGFGPAPSGTPDVLLPAALLLVVAAAILITVGFRRRRTVEVTNA